MYFPPAAAAEAIDVLHEEYDNTTAAKFPNGTVVIKDHRNIGTRTLSSDCLILITLTALHLLLCINKVLTSCINSPVYTSYQQIPSTLLLTRILLPLAMLFVTKVEFLRMVQ